MSEGPAAVGDVHQGLVRLQSSPCSCRQTSSSVPTNSLNYRISLGRKARFSSSLSRRKGLGLLQSGARICLLFHVGCLCPAALEASRLFAERSMAPLLAGPSFILARVPSITVTTLKYGRKVSGSRSLLVPNNHVVFAGNKTRFQPEPAPGHLHCLGLLGQRAKVNRSPLT